jgi:hypothetical protein
MLHGVEMLGGVFVFGGITAAHVAAYQAQTQMYPPVAHFYAFGADVGGGGGDFYLVEVFALVGHFIFRIPTPLRSRFNYALQ